MGKDMHYVSVAANNANSTAPPLGPLARRRQGRQTTLYDCLNASERCGLILQACEVLKECPRMTAMCAAYQVAKQYNVTIGEQDTRRVKRAVKRASCAPRP